MKLITGQFYQRSNSNIFRVIKITNGICKIRNVRNKTNGKIYTWQSEIFEQANKKKVRRIGTEELLRTLAYNIGQNPDDYEENRK